MLIENEFIVAAPVERVWEYLLKVERVAPCMPGAQLTETVDDRTWKGRVSVKLGPVSLSFAGTVVIDQRDDGEHRVVLKASGMEQRGKGAASAVITGWAEATDDGTRVRFAQDLTISGPIAQYSRGMMQDVSSRLTKQFADCLQANLQLEEAPGQGPASGSGERGGSGGAVEASPSWAPVSSDHSSSEDGSTTPAPSNAPDPDATSRDAPSSPAVPDGRPGAQRPHVAAAPVSGVQLAAWALWRAFLRSAERALETLLRFVRSLQT